MAAHSGFGRYRLYSCSDRPFYIAIVCLFLLTATYCQNITTPQASITNQTTSTPTTTTTPAPTTQPPSPIAENRDIGPCPCDLTAFSCDVNCCCDDDCSVDDKKSFSFCLPFSFTVDDKLCMKSEIILINNIPYQNNVTSNDLFCIYFNNYKEKNFYMNPDLVNTENDFNRQLNKFPSFSFQPKPEPPKEASGYYKSGDEILVVYESRTTGKLGQPKALSSTLCSDANPAAYLIESSNECVRRVSLSSDCENLKQLDSSSYYQKFRVVTTPALFGTYIPEHNLTVNNTFVFTVPAYGTSGPNSIFLPNVTDLYNNSYTVGVGLEQTLCEDDNGLFYNCTISSPRKNTTANRCDNVVKKVRYRIQYNGTYGITNVWAQFILYNVNINENLIPQVFTTEFEQFQQTGGNLPFKRSGNPGYVVGEPVMAGILRTSPSTDPAVNSVKIELNENRDQWFTVVRASAQGNCITDANKGRISVRFGEDIRSGCFIEFQQTNMSQFCSLLQEVIVNALEGAYKKDDQRFVAIFGNADVMKVGDWVPIIFQNVPKSIVAGEYTCSLSLGMHIQMLYANVGSLANPQAKILGVSFIYDNKQDVFFECIGFQCQPGTENNFVRVEITSSVSFVDVSVPATGYQGEAPLFLAKLPYDFFYPFLSGTAPNLSFSRFILIFNVVVSYLCCVIWTAH